MIESEKRAEQCLALAGDKKVAHDKYKIDNDYFIVTFYLKTNDRKAAFRLSDLNDAVVEKINPTMLAMEARHISIKSCSRWLMILNGN